MPVPTTVPSIPTPTRIPTNHAHAHARAPAHAPVNVFFGLGLPWLWAAVHWRIKGATDEWRRTYADIPGLIEAYPNGAFVVRKDGLSFSVAIFTLCAICTILILLLRRRSDPPAELGGDRKLAVATSAFLLFLWLMYILLSSLKAYEVELGIAPFGF